VTWIHNVMNQDAIMCLDDIECKKGLQVLTNPVGKETLVKRFNLAPTTVEKMSTLFGISGVCNVLGAIKTARFYGFGSNDTIVTICTDNIDRYHSVMDDMVETYGEVDEAQATARAHVFRDQKTDWIREGTTTTRRQWHNLKYYTWVEQQGKTVEELNGQLDPAWWVGHQEMVSEIDARLKAARG
jgi:cysteine synthase A